MQKKRGVLPVPRRALPDWGSFYEPRLTDRSTPDRSRNPPNNLDVSGLLSSLSFRLLITPSPYSAMRNY